MYSETVVSKLSSESRRDELNGNVGMSLSYPVAKVLDVSTRTLFTLEKLYCTVTLERRSSAACAVVGFGQGQRNWKEKFPGNRSVSGCFD